MSSILNRPIPPNNVLDPKYNGWEINCLTYTYASQTNEITIYDPNGQFDSYGPILGVYKQVISLSNDEMSKLKTAFDWQEYDRLQEEIKKLEDKLGIHHPKMGLR